MCDKNKPKRHIKSAGKATRISKFIVKVEATVNDKNMSQQEKDNKFKNLCETEKRYWGRGKSDQDAEYSHDQYYPRIKPSTYRRYLSDYRKAVASLNILNLGTKSRLKSLKLKFKDMDLSIIPHEQHEPPVSLALLTPKLPVLRDHVNYLIDKSVDDFKALHADLVSFRASMEIKAYYHCRPTKAVMVSVNKQGIRKVTAKNQSKNFKKVKIGLINLLLADLYKSSHWVDLAIWLALASGRRPIELFKTGSFSKVGKFSVNFSGQAKKSGVGANITYQIPLNVESDIFLQVFKSFRKKVATLRFYDKSFALLSHDEINSATSFKLNLSVKHFFGVYHQEDVVKTSFKSLRSLYIKYQELNNFKGGSLSLFFSQLLGHDKHDLSTFNSYAGYELIDVPLDSDFKLRFTVDNANPDRSLQKTRKELVALDALVDESGRKGLINLHNFTKNFLKKSPKSVINYTTLGRSVARGGSGASRAIIKDYLTLVSIE